MRLGLFRRFAPGDFPNVPEKFLQMLNNVMEDYSTALQRNLTLEDNLRSEVIKIDLENDTLTTIKLNTLQRNPIAAFFGGSNYFEYGEFTWGISPDTTLAVDVKVRWENPPDKPVRCTLIFLGGTPDDRSAV